MKILSQKINKKKKAITTTNKPQKDFVIISIQQKRKKGVVFLINICHMVFNIQRRTSLLEFFTNNKKKVYKIINFM